jgi:hypothetical protein
MCSLYNQQEATYNMSFIIISAVHVLGSRANDGGDDILVQEVKMKYICKWKRNFVNIVQITL